MRRGFYFLLLMCDGPFKNRWFTNGFPKEKGNSIIQCPSPKSGMLTMVHMYVHIKYVYTKFWGHIANTQMIPWLVEICYLWVDLPCRSTPPINCTQWNLFFWVQNSTQPSGWDHFPPKSHENVWFWCHIPVLVVAMVKNQKLIVLYYRGDNFTSVNTVNHIGGNNLPNSDVMECHWMVFLPLVIFFCSALNQTDPKW